MHTVVNLTNSPYDLQQKDGSLLRLPALSSVEGEFDDFYVQQLKSIGLYEVREGKKEGPKLKTPIAKKKAKKISPDVSLADVEKEMAEIRIFLIDHGVKVDGRWLIKKLRSEKAKVEKNLAKQKKAKKKS